MEGGGGYKDKITWAQRVERGNGNGQSHVLRGFFFTMYFEFDRLRRYGAGLLVLGAVNISKSR